MWRGAAAGVRAAAPSVTSRWSGSTPQSEKSAQSPPEWCAPSAKRRPPLSPAHKPPMTPRPLVRSLHGQAGCLGNLKSLSLFFLFFLRRDEFLFCISLAQQFDFHPHLSWWRWLKRDLLGQNAAVKTLSSTIPTGAKKAASLPAR